MKNVVITGSTRGIGLAMAREFLDLQRMRNVFLNAQDELSSTISGQVNAVLLRGLMIGLFLRRFDDA